MKIAANMCRGLKKSYEINARDLLPALMGKIKERRLVEDITITLNEFLDCLTLEEMAFEIFAGLAIPAPTARKALINFIETAIQKTYIDVL